MKILPDTHLLLWAATGSPRLSAEAASLMNDPNNDLFFSTASLWEISIKRGLRRANFRFDPRDLYRGLIDNNYVELTITSAQAFGVSHLPAIHKDPFDRILIAQATAENLLLLTADATIASYPGPIRRV